MSEIIRAAEMPVARLSSEQEQLLHACWEQSTYLANWAINRLAREDVIRTPAMKKLPPMPKVYLYGSASKRGGFLSWKWWEGAYAQAQSVLRHVEQRYRALRREIVWDQTAALPIFRYPQPFPVHNQCWTPRYEDGRPVINVALPGGRVDLVLRGGDEFRRQLALFRKVVDGEAKKCELSIRPQRTSSSNHRRLVPFRVPGGGERGFWRAMVKMVVRTEVAERNSDEERWLMLSTDPESLLVATLEGRRAWIINADHVRRALDWQAAHTVRLQRWREDLKAERRIAPDRAGQLLERQERSCLKHGRRMKSWCQEVAAWLTGFAVRRGITHVAYDHLPHDNLPGMPWEKLRLALDNALKGAGITFVKAGEEPKPEEEERCSNSVKRATVRLKVAARLVESRARQERGQSHPDVSKSPT